MKIAALVLLASALALPLAAAEPVWLTDLAQAKQEAAQGNKMILMNFTGSDWCFWCKKLRQEVFSSPDFTAFAQKNLALVEVDFPRTKQQTAELKAANATLKRDHAPTDGFPTIVVLKRQADGSWKQIWKQVGARITDEKKAPTAPENPKDWIAKIDGLRKL